MEDVLQSISPDTIIEIGPLAHSIYDLSNSTNNEIQKVNSVFELSQLFVKGPKDVSCNRSPFIADYLNSFFGLECPNDFLKAIKEENRIQFIQRVRDSSQFIYVADFNDCKSISDRDALFLSLFYTVFNALKPEQVRLAVVLPSFACDSSRAYITQCFEVMGRQVQGFCDSRQLLLSALTYNRLIEDSESTLIELDYDNLFISQIQAKKIVKTKEFFFDGYHKMIIQLRKLVLETLTKDKISLLWDKQKFLQFFYYVANEIFPSISLTSEEIINLTFNNESFSISKSNIECVFQPLISLLKKELEGKESAIFCLTSHLDKFGKHLASLLTHNIKVYYSNDVLRYFQKSMLTIPPTVSEILPSVKTTFQNFKKLFLLQEIASSEEKPSDEKDEDFDKYSLKQIISEMFREGEAKRVKKLSPFYRSWEILSSNQETKFDKYENDTQVTEFSCFLQWISFN